MSTLEEDAQERKLTRHMRITAEFTVINIFDLIENSGNAPDFNREYFTKDVEEIVEQTVGEVIIAHIAMRNSGLA